MVSARCCENLTVKQCFHGGKEEPVHPEANWRHSFSSSSDVHGIAYKVFPWMHVGPHSGASGHARILWVLSNPFTSETQPYNTYVCVFGGLDAQRSYCNRQRGTAPRFGRLLFNRVVHSFFRLFIYSLFGNTSLSLYGAPALGCRVEQPSLSPRGLDLSLRWSFRYMPILTTAVRPLSLVFCTLFSPPPVLR